MRTCYLHIGTHKTGTTSIQVALDGARETLKQRGFLYPLSGRPDAHASSGHHKLSHELYGGPSRLADCTNVTAVIEEIRGSDHDVIISAEGLQFAVHNRPKFAAFLDRLQDVTPRVVVIVYLRDQDDYARSLYLELLKHGYAEPFDVFLSSVLRDHAVCWDDVRFSFDYGELLDALPPRDGVGIVARSYQRGRPILPDLLSIMGLTRADVGTNAEPAENPPIAAATSFEFFYAHRTGSHASERIARAAAAALNGAALDLTAPLRRSILAEFDASNRTVNARFGCELAVLTAASADARSAGVPHLEQVFSLPAVKLVESVSGVFEQSLQAVQLQLSSAIHESNSLAAARDGAIGARDAVIAERDAVIAARAAVIAERDRLGQEIAEKHAEIAELARQAEIADAEIRRLAAANAALTGERDAMLGSRSWRMTAPLRRLVTWSRRVVLPILRRVIGQPRP